MTEVLRSTYASAVVNQTQFNDIISFECSYGLNEIPELTFTLPCGSKIVNAIPVGRADFHNVIMFGNRMIPVEFFLNGALLFSGLVSTVQLVISAESNQSIVQITARHWLDVLNMIPLISESSHPMNPFSFMGDPSQLVVRSPLGGAGFGGEVYTKLLSFVNSETIHQDFWGAVRNWLIALSSRDYRPASSVFGGPIKIGTMGPTVLSRIISPDPIKFPKSKFGDVSLALQEDLMLLFFGQFLSGTGESGSSIGSRLLGYFFPSFLLDLVPMPDKALVVPSWPPHSGVLDNGYPIFYIAPYEHSLATGAYNPQRPIRFCGIYGIGPTTVTNAELEKKDTPTALGSYVSTINTDGVFIFHRAPTFISRLRQPPIMLLNYGGSGLRDAPDERVVRVSKEKYKDLFSFSKNLADMLAYYIYCVNSVANRTARVACPPNPGIFRPGTTVAIYTHGAGNNPFIEPPWFGRIVKTVISGSYSGGSGDVRIIYQLDSCRNFLENSSLKEIFHRIHPWYGPISFNGGYLL